MGRPPMMRFDRDELLEQASRARSRRQWRRAIGLYRELLALEPNSVELHERLAPLLAQTRQEFDAWNSYRAIAHAALREGREDRAIAVFREASRALPQEIQAWQGLARLLARGGEPDAAIDVLLEGSRQFRAQFHRPQAIHLLRRARAIDPWHFEVVLELALHLGRADQRSEATMLLAGLADRCDERRLKRVRAAQWAVEPGARSLLRWLMGWGDRETGVPEPELELDLELEPGPMRRNIAPVLTLARRMAHGSRDAEGDREDERSSAAY